MSKSSNHVIPSRPGTIEQLQAVYNQVEFRPPNNTPHCRACGKELKLVELENGEAMLSHVEPGA